jgi:type VI secretion system protein ImpK
MQRINELTRDCFDAINRLRLSEPSSLAAPETLRHRLRGCVEDLIERAGDAGFSQQDAQDIAYAVVALCDEVMLALPEPYRHFWMNHLLQLHFFKENVAGEGFFNRLQQVRADPNRREVLQVYYLCLVFGFEGRHRFHGGEAALSRLTEAVQAELAAGLTYPPEVLSPAGDRVSEPGFQVRRRAPLMVLSAAALALSLLLSAALRFSVTGSATRVARELDAVSAHLTSKELR